MALYYELSIDDAGFAAFFAAHKHAGYSPQQLGNVREVKLAGGVVGFFRPVGSVGSGAQRISCGTGSGAISDSAGTTPSSPRDEAAKDHNGGCRLGYPSRTSLS